MLRAAVLRATMLRTLLIAFALSVTAAHAVGPAFVPGRPGATESAVSVPKGALQLETEIASVTHNDGADDAWSVGATAFRYGVAHGADVELIVQPYLDDGADQGFGDVTLRARRTFAGQDGGTSFGVIGYVTLPTATDGLGAEDVEGGLIAAGAVDLSERFNLAWTAGVAAVSNGDDYDTATSGALTLGMGLTDAWGAYVEVGAEHQDETGAFAGAGLTWLVAETTQLDIGFDAGLNDDADDLNVFVGWARRF